MAKGDIGEPINVINPGGHSYSVKSTAKGSTKKIAAEKQSLKSRPAAPKVGKKTGKTAKVKTPTQSKSIPKIAKASKGRLSKGSEKSKKPDTKTNFKGATKTQKNPYRG